MNREKSIVRVTVWGAVANVVLAVAKLVAGIVGRSAAMTADAIHSFSDLVSDVIVLVMVKVASRGNDKDHEYGHGKFETLATVAVALLLLAVGGKMLADGVSRIAGFFRGEQMVVPGMIAFWAALVSIAVKEALYQYTVHCGRRLDSPTVVANAWHHRSDALSSIGTAIGIGGALLLGPDWAVLDPIAAIIVSLLIMKVSLELILPCVGELLEHSLPEEEERYIRELILSYPGVSDPHNLRTRRIGAYRAIEVHFRMDGQTTINEAHATTRLIEDALRKRFGQKTIINTHVEPVKNR